MKLRLPEWFVDRLIARAQRTPYVHLEGYMNRWWLLPYNRTGYAVRVHQFLASDHGRDLHNHPWGYTSVVLRGGYWEETFLDEATMCLPGTDLCLHGDEVRQRRWYGPGSVLVRPADSFHRIELWRRPDGSEESCWTLFMTGPQRERRDPEHSCWGFMVDDVYIPADIYLGDQYIPTDYAGTGRG